MPNGELKPIKLGEEPPVEIRVMPEQFYFKKMPKAPREGGGRPKMTLIIIMVIVVIGLMAVAAYLFTQSLGTEKVKQPEKEALPANIPTNAPVNVPPVNVPPVNVPPINAPPLPVCGNEICETGEDATNCPDDCPLPLPPPPEPPAALPLAVDTDSDGLSDVEDLLYSVDAAKVDTDEDGYRDGLEVINLYNPSGFAPEKIEETALVKIYSNPTYRYTIFYPSSWLARALDETDRETMFTSATGEFMQVIVEDNEDNLPLMDWYLAKSPGVNPADVGTASTKDGLVGIKSPDGLTAYFSVNNKIYAITYNVGVKTELNYKSTFEMMIKSFKL